MKIFAQAQALIYPLLDGMPSAYQRQSLKALLELFLRAQGAPLPEHSPLKSASALGQFLAVYAWSLRQVIRHSPSVTAYIPQVDIQFLLCIA